MKGASIHLKSQRTSWNNDAYKHRNFALIKTRLNRIE
jgi:hypothetical protein